MKKFVRFFSAAILGAALAFFAMKIYTDEQLAKIRTVEELRSEQSKSDNLHQVSYAIPAEVMDFTVAAEKTVNAVVHVKTTYEINGGSYTFDPIRHFFFGDGMYQKQPRIGAGAGSGVIMSTDGYIVTNNHVVDGATGIEIVTNDNQTFQAEVIGQDPSTDLALLKVEAEGLPNIDLGNSDDLKIGEWVLAVGNPFNLKSTVTAGIVSAKGRDINILANGPDGISAVESFIQTDAAVNPGNSGGALVNGRGELVGINAAIKSNTGSYTGYSFAIPVNIVSKIVEDLLEFGAVQRGYLGVRISNLDKAIQEFEEVNAKEGIYVASTLDKGAAKKAGIESGDVIVKIAGRTVKNVTELQEQLSRFRPGDEILITINRSGKLIDMPLTLRNKYGETDLTPKEALELRDKLNASFSEVDKELQEKLGIDAGVQVKDLGNGKMRSAGIVPEFIILKVDQESIKSEDHLYEVLEEKSGGVLLEGIYPNGKRAFYGFGL